MIATHKRYCNHHNHLSSMVCLLPDVNAEAGLEAAGKQGARHSPSLKLSSFLGGIVLVYVDTSEELKVL